MLNPKKATVLVALLGGFALTGVGVAQAQGEPATPKCSQNEDGYVCVGHVEWDYTVKSGKVAMKTTAKSDADSTADRTTKGTAKSPAKSAVKGKDNCSLSARSSVKTETKVSGRKDTEVHQATTQKTTMECSGRVSR